MALAGEEIDRLRTRLAAYYAAEDAVLRNQSYEMDGRKLTRAELADIRRGIDGIRRELANAAGAALVAKGRMRRGYVR